MNKRVIIHGNTKLNYSWFLLTLRDGLSRNGCEIKEIDFKTTPLDKVEEILYDYEPDILFTHLSFHGHHNLSRLLGIYEQIRDHIGTKVIHTLSDARTEPRYSGKIDFAFDLALVNQLKNLKKFSNMWGIPAYYWPYSSLTYDEMAKPNKKLAYKEPVFTGTVYAHADRSSFIQRLSRVMKIRTIGTRSPQDLRHKTPELSVSAKCILGLCTGYGNNIYGYIDVRPFQYMGTGAFMIMRRFPVFKEFFPDDIYVGFDDYKSPEFVAHLWAKWNKKDTREMRRKAFDFVQKYHSAEVRMKHTLELIDGERDKIPALLHELEDL